MHTIIYIAVLSPPGEKSEDVPSTGVMIVERQPDGQVRMIDFMCPFGCGKRMRRPICLANEQRRTVCWKATLNEKNQPTVEPELNCLDGCGKRYRIVNGEVIEQQVPT
jgi:Family of unknown function (DUF6527)